MSKGASLDDGGTDLPEQTDLLQAAFTTSHIKSMLQEEQGIGILLKPAIDRVGESSAVFIRNLLSQAMIESRNSAIESNKKDSNAGVTLECLRRVVIKNDEFQILRGVLDEFQVELVASTKSTSLLLSGMQTKKKPATSKPKGEPRKRASSSKSATAAKFAKGLLQEVQVDVTTSDQPVDTAIVADEEDYD